MTTPGRLAVASAVETLAIQLAIVAAAAGTAGLHRDGEE